MNNSFRHRRKKSAGLRPSDLPPIGSEKIVQTDLLGQFRENISGFKGGVAHIRLRIGRDVVRLLEHPAFSVPLMIETLSWWAMDLRFMVSKNWPCQSRMDTDIERTRIFANLF